MKKINKFLSIVALTMALSSTYTLVGCSGNNSNASSSSGGAQASTSGQTDGKVTYSVQVNTNSGRGLANINVEVYKDGKSVYYDITDENGYISFALDAGDYTIKLEDYPKSFTFDQDTFNVSATSPNVVATCTTGVIDESVPVGYTYSLGDIMYDFTITDASTNAVVTLSDLLKDNKMVLLNFWYSSCSPCNKEFPYIETAYEEYSNSVEVVSLNPYPSDTTQTVKDFKENNGYTFTMGKDTIDLYENFEVSAFPTSIVIDRYGTICFEAVGSFSDADEVKEIFSIYTADDYTSSKIYEGSTIRNKPTTTMPSSAEIEKVANGTGFNGTYHKETSENDAEWTWPWVIDSSKNAIKPSNYHEASSYSTIYCDFTCDVDDVLAFDFFCSTGTDDIVYVLVDGVIYQQISGISTSWQTCYAYVADIAGEHSLAIMYYKDSSGNTGDDTIYLNNIRLTSTSSISTPTYIYRSMACGYDEATSAYTSFKNAVYNENDGYYHVNSANGPLVLANLLKPSNWSQYYFYNYVSEGYFKASENDPTTVLTQYSSYASNSTIPGYCPVTKELKEAIQRAMEIYAPQENRQTYENEWLEICYYYAAYGTNGVELSTPIKGVALFEAYEGKLGSNTVTFEVQVMPRGLYTKFTPEKSGVYEIQGTSEYETAAWVYDSNHNLLTDEGMLYRDALMRDADDDNFMYYVYLEEGETYYICTAFYDFYQLGDLTFDISYKASNGSYLRQCAHPEFTTEGVDDDNMPTGKIIVTGINIQLGEDGYYHELKEDGTLGSIIYVDFYSYSNTFPSNTIEQIITLGGFNFTVDEDGYAVEDETAEDLTKQAEEYLNKVNTDKTSELYGMVAVDENLATLLQKLMDKYTFAGVDHSWIMIAYYYNYLG